jgi:hypothetical protein
MHEENDECQCGLWKLGPYWEDNHDKLGNGDDSRELGVKGATQDEGDARNTVREEARHVSPLYRVGGVLS